MASCCWLGFLGFVLVGLVGSASSTSFMRLQHRYSHLQGSAKRGALTSEHYHRLLSHDALRRGRHRDLLEATSFPLGGKADPTAAGLYFTELEIGTPPSSYYAQVDTGSDLLWLGCDSCKTCPTKTKLGVRLKSYDPASSRSSHELTCDDSFCRTSCLPGQLCLYQLTYGDGSTSEGYYVRDILELPNVNNRSLNSDNATITFGCAVSANGGLQNHDQALDGILGLGQSNVSIIQQLARQGKTSQIFAHCLEGEGGGGGVLVIGEVKEPGLAYTPIRSNQLHYNVNLMSIEVRGRSLKMETPSNGNGQLAGTIFDSGTTLAYIAESSYLALLQEILVSQALQQIPGEDLACIRHDGSLDDDYPSVTFTFESGSTMTVQPHDYFIQVQTDRGNAFCIGFQSSLSNSPDLTILGDLVLKNKLVVYDLENQRIGWVDYNCSSSVTVLTSTGKPAQVFATAIGSSGHLAPNMEIEINLAIFLLTFMLMVI